MYQPTCEVGRQVRRSLQVLLADWGVRPDTVDDTLVVVEELVANAVDHARTPFRLTVDLRGPVLRVTVRDCCDRAPQTRPLDPRAERGRGLQLIDGLTAQWGHAPWRCGSPDREPRGPGSSGNMVWAEFAA